MAASKHFDKIAWVIISITLVIAILFMNGGALGLTAAARTMGYESRLFDITRVHTIDIVMDDWESFIEGCEDEEYASATVIIDGEAYKNVGIRAKGNTSLSSVKSMNSQRYSFKIEFDQYDSTRSYYGLDKLSLNNLIQDNTMMKDYLTYRMMGEFGVAAPLCSYVYITVNGEDWGLYLAVEGVEDAFLERNYGSDYGELYKPDSLSFGGGRGNGMDFDIDEILESMEDMGFDFSGIFGGSSGKTAEIPDMSQMPDMENMPDMGFSMGGKGGNMFGSMGSDDVKLQYIDDDPDSYSNIFDSAKTDITDADKARLIASLKSLSANENLEDALDIDSVLRYFVVHNFVCNGDSYTGSMIHNYYLYEEDGRLAMIPWDYNLAFGTFQSSDATDTVNSPIDSPVSGSMDGDRPMVEWIFSDEAYTELYHQYFAEFLEQIDFAALIDETASLIAPYVEKDPSKFCTVEEFETGAAAIRQFCLLREQSVEGQLNGTIPSTSDGQSADSSSLIDASGLTISDMGSMNNGMGGFGGGDRGGRGQTDKGFGGEIPDNIPTAEGMSSGGRAASGIMQTDAELSAEAPAGSSDSMTDADTRSEDSGAQTPPSAPNQPDSTQTPESGSGGFPDGGFTGSFPGMGIDSGQASGGGTTPDTGAAPSAGDAPSMENMPGRGGFSGMGDGFDASSFGSAPTSGGSDMTAWIWIAVSTAVLAAGLVTAKVYRH